MSEVLQSPVLKCSTSTSTVVGVAVGNMLEWFDLTVYGLFAPQIAQTFFPTTDRTASLLLAFAGFGTSYIARPFGALLLGRYSDTAGRRASLTLSISLMTRGTLMITVTPTYRQIGVWAPLILVISRLLQGFSAGGEFGPAVAVLIEGRVANRGFLASWLLATQGASILLASLFGLALSNILDPFDLASWGWRLPFVFGLLIAPVGLALRARLVDRAVLFNAPAAPIRELCSESKRNFFIAIGAVLLSTAATYFLIYLPTYAQQALHLSQRLGYSAVFVGVALGTVMTPICGAIADRVDRRQLMLGAAIAFLIGVAPLLYLLASCPSQHMLFGVILVLSLIRSVYQGGLAAFLAECFPTRLRATGVNLAISLGAGVFGGFSPLLLTWVIRATGQVTAPAFYLMGMAALSITALLFSVRRVPLQP